MILTPPTFEEAVQHITDPDYGLGVAWLWQLPPDWPGTKAAKIHDLRYDFLLPGEDTTEIDDEFSDNCDKENCNEIQTFVFYRLCRVRGEIFERGPELCSLVGEHDWKPCTYGQAGIVYNLRCVRCGLHKPLTIDE